MHEKLDLKNPVTYTQKIQWLKLHNTDPYFSKLVDKYQVRQIVEDKIGSEYLIPLLGVWPRFEEINFEQLPNQFVLKTTHDSGNIFICTDKTSFNFDLAKRKLNSALSTNYFYKSREYPYKNAVPAIIAEKYMGDGNQKELDDYKFFCFNGLPKFVEITTGKGTQKVKAYFDMEMNRLPFNTGQVYPDDGISFPANFNEMIEIAKILSDNLLHVRIDLYNINGRIYFGEYTFHNAGGIIHFDPPEWNKNIGDMLTIPSKN